MAVNLVEPNNVYSIDGIMLASVAAGIRYQGRDDLVLIQLEDNTKTAAVFTKNKFCAAPVQLALQHLQDAAPKYLIINAGNANAGTGLPGIQSAKATTDHVAEQMHVNASEVLPFSTGVIGELLDSEKIKQQLPILQNCLAQENWLSAARAIMTTDTVAKAASEKITLAGHDIHITGISKGSGMIQPNMATMLAYIATDMEIEKPQLQHILNAAVAQSFNAITVDSDTSTNDACLLMATGKSQISFSSLASSEQEKFCNVLKHVMQRLAQAIVRDGEGASKFVEVRVEQANSFEQAKNIAYSVANSPLVKTALSASDPNWGRIMAAAGKCDDDTLDLSKANLFINGKQIVSMGGLASSYSEELGKQAMAPEEIEIIIQLNSGSFQHRVWTTDLTHEYVSINADYRS